MAAMRAAERIIDRYIRQGSQLLRKSRIVFFLLRMEAQILQQQNLTRLPACRLPTCRPSISTP